MIPGPVPDREARLRAWHTLEQQASLQWAIASGISGDAAREMRRMARQLREVADWLRKEPDVPEPAPSEQQ